MYNTTYTALLIVFGGMSTQTRLALRANEQRKKKKG
jgi:hypothetical protein